MRGRVVRADAGASMGQMLADNGGASESSWVEKASFLQQRRCRKIIVMGGSSAHGRRGAMRRLSLSQRGLSGESTF